MLYRAVGNVLFVQPAGCAMLTRLRPHRERLEAKQSRKPVRATRQAPPIIPAWTAADQARWHRSADERQSFGERLGRWRRVCSWWLFTADQLDFMV